MNEEILTIKDVAIMLKVKPVTIYKLLSLKKIPGVKISGAWRFRYGMILEWIDRDCVLEAQKTIVPRIPQVKDDSLSQEFTLIT